MTAINRSCGRGAATLGAVALLCAAAWGGAFAQTAEPGARPNPVRPAPVRAAVASPDTAIRPAAPRAPAPQAVMPVPTAASAPAKAAPKGPSDLGSSRDPIAIDADRLDVFDKEGRAVFTGNVVAVQADTTMKCTVMNVFYESSRAGGGDKPARSAPGLSNDSSIKRIACQGPVTITTKTQTATGDRAEFDRLNNKVYIIGNAVLADGPNVTRGERVVYDMTTAVANIEGGRVRALIVPGSQKDTPAPKEAPKPKREADAQKDRPKPR